MLTANFGGAIVAARPRAEPAERGLAIDASVTFGVRGATGVAGAIDTSRKF
jgi:hypothetical protein